MLIEKLGAAFAQTVAIEGLQPSLKNRVRLGFCLPMRNSRLQSSENMKPHRLGRGRVVEAIFAGNNGGLHSERYPHIRLLSNCVPDKTFGSDTNHGESGFTQRE